MSINSFTRRDNGKRDGDIAGVEVGKKRVLPRILRKPARLFNRLLAGNVMISAREWATIALAIVVVAYVGVVTNSRQGYSALVEVPANIGFGINNVSVEGVYEAPESDVMNRLEISSANSLFSFDIEKARKNLLNLDWVKDAAVKKTYPDRLVVRIKEYEPFAVWQNENALSLIERGGKKIDRFRKKFANLPLLVGKGANVHGVDVVSLVAEESALERQVKAYIRIANQRWDLWLKNGVIVRLPNKNVNEALKRLIRLDATYGLLSRDVEIVDLRLKNRLVVTLGQSILRRGVRQSEDMNSPGKEKKI